MSCQNKPKLSNPTNTPNTNAPLSSITPPTASVSTIVTTNTTTTITEHQERTNTTRTVENRTDAYDLGDRVTDIQIQPYMRATNIQFFATKMRPNTKVFAFFDGVAVNEFITPLQGTTGQQLITDDKGQIAGTFHVPEGRFFTGSKKFELSADGNNIGDPDMETTYAESTFFSGGIDVTKQKTSMNVITSSVKTSTATESRDITNTSVTSNTIVNKPPATPAPKEPPPPPVVAPPPPVVATPPPVVSPPTPPTTQPTPRISSGVGKSCRSRREFSVLKDVYAMEGEYTAAESVRPILLATALEAGLMSQSEYDAALAKMNKSIQPTPRGLQYSDVGSIITTLSAHINAKYTGETNANGSCTMRSWSQWLSPNQSKDWLWIGGRPTYTDPVAQSFTLDFNCFITGLDVYFAEIDLKSDSIFFNIRDMVNGYPGTTILAEKTFKPIDITKSDDSTIPFHVEFDFPVYCEAGKEYCFVVGGTSPDTRIWVSKMGQEVVDQPGKIVETQPSLGSSFRSQNNTTWTAEQFEDIKYKLYAAQFKDTKMKLSFEHLPERIKFSRDPFESESGKNKIRVYVMDHGFNVNDKITISIAEDEYIEVEISVGLLQINVPITSTNFEAIISEYRVIDNKHFIKMKNIKGSFSVNDRFTCNAVTENVSDNFLITKIGFSDTTKISNDGKINIKQSSGIFKSNGTSSTNGIPIGELRKQHIISEVDSMDSFIITITTNATLTGRFGGESVYADINEKYEIYNISGSYLPYDSSEVIKYQGIGHNPINSIFSDAEYQRQEEKDIVLGEDNYLGQPYKLVSKDNDAIGNRKSLLTMEFETANELISPVVNTDTFSITAISNRIEWVDSDQYEIEPNSMGRYLSESDPMNGSENYKYVTRTVNLINPAVDLFVAFDVYKDLDADFDVWIKLLAPEETDIDIDTKRWMRVNGINKNYNSSDLADSVDLEITLSDMKLDVYTNNTSFSTIEWEDLPYETFSSFKLKLVGRSKNPAKPPLFHSLRIIAIT